MKKNGISYIEGILKTNQNTVYNQPCSTKLLNIAHKIS